LRNGIDTCAFRYGLPLGNRHPEFRNARSEIL
jgi:hypothetical protein